MKGRERGIMHMAKGKRVEVNKGDRYGSLTVIEELEPHINPSGRKVRRFKCLCECGNTTVVNLNNLRSGKSSSCGCHKAKTNKYDLSGEYGIGYTSNGGKFLFDLENYDLLKNYCWNIGKNGYVQAIDRSTGKIVRLHRLIMHPKKDEVVDHVNHDKFNNCKSNLRVCSHGDNMKNKSISKNNTSGVTGVQWDKRTGKWKVGIIKNREYIFLGYFASKEDAIKARIKAELELFSKYAPTYNYFTEEQKQMILNNEMSSEDIVEILKLNQYIEQCV